MPTQGIKYICPGKCDNLPGRLIQPYCESFPPILMIIGEAPGEEEEKLGRPFVGKSGQELNNYLSRVGIPPSRCYKTNTVKCHPPGNRDPSVSEAECCSQVMRQELDYLRPRFIATAGRFATQSFLGPINMEMVHGIPYRVPMPWGFSTVIPVYHPAAGLHDTFNMSLIMADFLAVKDAMAGAIPVRNLGEHITPPPYHLIEDGEDPTPYLTDRVSIDTETQDEKDTPWSLQFCCGDVGHVILAENKVSVAKFSKHIEDPDVLCIIHNSLFDLKVLAYMLCHPARFTDTMIMAYLLQTEPQGLKPLTFRHLQVKMDEYEDVVGPRTQEMALDYLVRVACRDWPKLPPVLEMKAGKPKVRQPQTINQKVNRILGDLSNGKEIDLYDRWYTAPAGDGRAMVEEVMGPMRRAYLKDLPLPKALQYAATDAWATDKIHPILDQRIEAMGLRGVLERDLGVVLMVECMQRNGMPINPPYFRTLREEFTDEMDEVKRRIEAMVGDVHPGSDPQVLALMEKLGLMHAKRRWVGGKEVIVRKKMTDIAALELVKDKHPVVPEIMRWKSLSKLVTSFIDVLLEKKDEDNRIRTTLRITRVVTGRLASSNPNLMAQPTRTEDGRKIRGGFQAPPGYSFVSGDYAQVEMRVVAHISGDKNMIDVFCTGKDLHSYTAAGMFGIPIDQVDEMKHRYPAKRVGFGILNMISAKKLLKEMTVGGAENHTEATCQKMIDDWFQLYYGIADYVEERKSEARRTGMVRDWSGRFRLVPEVLSCHRSIVEAGIRQAVNAPIQQGAQSIIKEAMRQLVPLYQSFGEENWCPLLQIHDSLENLVRDDLIPDVIDVMKGVMENCVPLVVPLRTDFKVGKMWDDMKKWKG